MSGIHKEARVGFSSTFEPLLDDRRRRVRQIRRKDLIRASRSESPQLRALASRFKHAIRSEARRITPDRILVTVAAVVTALIVHGVVNAVVLPVLGVRVLGLGLASFVACIVLAHYAFKAYVRRGTLNQLARTAVAEGMCGSCAFSLRGTPPAEDGCVVCPECGAAWKAERIVSPYWQDPTSDVLRGSFRAWITPGVLPIENLYTPDDRGRYVQTPDARLLRVRAEHLGAITAREQHAMRRRMRRVGRWARLGLFFALVWIPAMILWGAWKVWTNDEVLGAWLLFALGLIIGIPVATIPFGAAFSTPHRTSRAIVRLGRCGTCLLDLGGAPADAAGRAVCERCGSAWLNQTPRQVP